MVNSDRIPHTTIVIDHFRSKVDGNTDEDWVYFLSHAHADHTVGLRDGWNGGTIFCSEITKRLIELEFRDISEHLIALPMNESVLFGVDEDGEHVNVTLLDANHCPGAVMFLFEGRFGRVLHTGDFRYSPEMLAALKSHLGTEPLDLAFVDNTYVLTNREVLTMKSAVSEMVDIVRSSIRNHDEQVTRVYVGLHKIGKENMLIELAKLLDIRVRVGYRRWTRLKAMMGESSDELLHHFVYRTENEKDEDGSLIVEIVHTKGLTLDFLREQRKKYNDCNTIGILPSGLCYVEGKLSTCVKDDAGEVELYTVHYSSHSSKSELERFVSELSVKQIRASSDYSNDAKVALMNMTKTQSFFSSDSTPRNPPRFYRYRVIAGIKSRYNRDSNRPLKSRKRSRGPRNRTSSRSRKLRVTSINASADEHLSSDVAVVVPVECLPVLSVQQPSSSLSSGRFTKVRHDRCVFARSVLRDIAASNHLRE